MSRRNGGRGGRRGIATPVSGFNPNAVLGLVIDLDARDLTAGAVTSWTDRKNGYSFSGTATRDAVINGSASVTFNGSSDILTSASVTHLAAKSAITMVVLGCGTSAILVPVDIARWSLVAIAAALVFFLARLPTRAEPALA